MSKNGKWKGRQTFELPSFVANVDVRSFPLSYQNEQFGQVQPDIEALCDLPSCRSSSGRPIRRLACFHTFHEACASATGPCPICRIPLEKKIEELSQSFNKGLSSSTCEYDSSDSSDDDDFDTEQHLPNPSTNTCNYYTSQAWETPSPMPLMHIIQWNNPQMPTEYKHFFNQLDDHLKPFKTNHLIKLLKAGPHLKFSFLDYQPLTYPLQSQCTITFQAGTFLKICHNLQFRDGAEAMLVLS